MQIRPERGVILMLSLAVLAPQCSVTTPSDLVDVELAVSDTVVGVADTIDVRVTATNHGREAVELSSAGCPQLFRVLDTRGEVVGPEPVYCALVNYAPVTLEMGDSFDWEYRWHGLGTDGDRLPAGTYRLQGWAQPIDGEARYSTLLRVRVSAP